MNFAALAQQCAPLVHPATARAVVAAESGSNPYAIGVTRGVLARQPRSRTEAIATARRLLRDGWNFDAGLGQINVRNWSRLGLTLESSFEPCPSLRAMQAVLVDCFASALSRSGRPQVALRQAFSCYNAGDFKTGFSSGYVQRVVFAASDSSYPGIRVPTK